jgi:hypothetical protein
LILDIGVLIILIFALKFLFTKFGEKLREFEKLRNNEIVRKLRMLNKAKYEAYGLQFYWEDDNILEITQEIEQEFEQNLNSKNRGKRQNLTKFS